jgi:hypothetical protein
MKKIGSIILSVLITSMTNAQSPCNSPEASQFDFWLGHWNLTWNDTLKGSNLIEKMMDGCTIHEHFNDPATNFRGESWSVYNPQQKKWQQTWVDNQGGYIVLTGGMEGSEMILTTEEQKLATGTKISRMVFYNIKRDSFDWRWEASTDNGKSWKVNWLIHYLQAK